jgi:hypothetical protein
MGIQLFLNRPQFALINNISNDTDIPDTGSLLFVPDINYLTKFSNGDLGISEKLNQKIFAKNISSLKTVEQLNIFLKATGYKLVKDPTSYFKNGKFNIPLSDLSMSLEGSLTGLKAIEKSIIQSIFESQKPYMEIVKIVVGSFVKIEDIIARAQVFSTSFPKYLSDNSGNPLAPIIALTSCHSQKPSTNPKAAGYKKTNISGYMNQLGELSKPSAGSKEKQKISGTNSAITGTQSYPNLSGNYGYQVIDTQYSTGTFDPNVNYTYEYIDIPYIPITKPSLQEGDSYIEDELWEKPDNIIFGIYNWLGKSINPPNFITQNKKYFGTFSNYTKNDSVILNTYGEYITDYTNAKMDSMNITDTDIRNKSLNLVKNIDFSENGSTQSNFSGLSPMIDRIISNNYLSSFSKSNQDNKFKVLIDEKISYNGAYAPKKINYKGHDMWIDPEAEYDLKIIKVIPILKNKDINISTYTERRKLGKDIPLTSIKYNPQLFKEDLYSKNLYGSRFDNDNDIINRYIDVNDLIYYYGDSEYVDIYINKKVNININSSKSSKTNYKGTVTNDQFFKNWIETNIDEWLKAETYYIVEGTYINKKGGNPKSLSNSSGDYHFGDFIGIFTPFINLFIDIVSKLFPQIAALEKTLSDPKTFLTDIIIRKLGDDYKTQSPNFLMFSTDFINKFNKIKTFESSIISQTKKINNLQKNFTLDKQVEIKNLQKDLQEQIADIKKRVDESGLKKYVYVDKLGNIKFVLDGSATTSLFGLTFGLKLSDLTFGLILKLPNINSSVANFLKLSNDELNDEIRNSKILGNLSLNNQPKITTTNKEVDTIQYSTGVYIPGYTYTYIYQTQYENELNNQAKKLEDNGDIQGAIQSYRDVLKTNPKNFTALSELAKLLELESIITQPILEFILKMTTFPMNIIKKIIEYILSVFQKITNPLTLIPVITDFMTFKWILQFFSPTFIMKIAGITFDIQKWTDWMYNCEKYPDDFQFDLNEVFGFDFMPPFPTYNKKQFIPFIKGFNKQGLNIGPLQTLKYILCLLESIINAFIDFIWALFGIGALIPQPYIHLCKMVNEPSIQDMVDIASGKVLLNNPDASYDFSYDITLPDGTIINSLDYVALEQWIQQNPDIQILFNF